MNLFYTDKSTFTDCLQVQDSVSWVWIPLKCFCCDSEFLSTVKRTFTVIYPVQDSLSWVWIPLRLQCFCYNCEFLSTGKSTFTICYPVQDSVLWAWIPLGLICFYYISEFIIYWLNHIHCLLPSARQFVMGLNPIKILLLQLRVSFYW